MSYTVGDPMKLNYGLHLAYCTNAHRGDTWAETFAKLQQHTLAVRERVCPGQPFGIGLRLCGPAARGLSDRATLLAFHHWLEQQQCYVVGMHGFPCGHLRNRLAAAQVFLPDWTSPERLAYTNLLFDLLAQLLPADLEGSVSTLPGAVKGVAYVLMVQRSNFHNSDASDVRREFQKAAATALENGKAKP